MGSTARGRRDVVLAAVLWSLSGVITKSIALDPLSIAFYRGGFAGLLLIPFVPRRRWRLPRALVPLGLVFGAMTGAFIGAIKATTAANAIFLQYSSCLWVVPLGWVVLGERPDRRTLQAISLVTVGVGVIAVWGHGDTPREWWGVGLGLGSGLAYATVVIGLRRFRALDPVWLAGVNNLLGALAMGLGMSLVSAPPAVPTLAQAIALAGFGGIQMAIPYVLFARGLREVSAPEAGLLTLIEPILNPVWVVLVAHEQPHPATLVGGACLLAGVALRYRPAPKLTAAGSEPGR